MESNEWVKVPPGGNVAEKVAVRGWTMVARGRGVRVAVALPPPWSLSAGVRGAGVCVAANLLPSCCCRMSGRNTEASGAAGPLLPSAFLKTSGKNIG